MKASALYGIPLWLFLISPVVLADASNDVLMIDDWSAEAAVARRFGTPIMVLFSGDDCGYCDRLKKEVLEPLMRRGELRGFARIRELDIDRGGKIKDFDGEKIRTKIFVKRYGIYATPTLMLVDYRGEVLGTPIVGFNTSEDYVPYLEYFMDVAYWEPQKVGPPCGEGFAVESFDDDDWKRAIYVTQTGGLR